jgi:oligopeptide/dipeptide ABC transporter ATP-binding protein
VTPPLLEIENLSVRFDTAEGPVGAVDAVSLAIEPGEILGLVGESGSGKSVTAQAVLRLVRPPGRITAGAIRFQGRDLLAVPEAEMGTVRGRGIGMVWQNPRTALNPVMPVGRQIARLLERHRGATAAEARQGAIAMLAAVGIAEPERRARHYAHQLSGGMCQRVMIGMALATRPLLLLADEPTTGLDVLVAARILALLKEAGSATGAAILLITHDLGTVAESCSRVAVMHAGQVVEMAPVRRLFRAPAHPYTRALVAAIPRLDRELALQTVPGAVPSLLRIGPGCRYAGRCPQVMPRCAQDRPPMAEIAPGHQVACFAVAA